MRRSYLDYAMSVIIGRALPDVRDGLKPVHRRVLYAMYDTGQHRRTSRTEVGAHRRDGDRQVPPARRPGRLRHDRAPGAGLLHALPARRRAGELRLGRRRPAGGDALHRDPARQASAHEMLRDIEKETVDFGPNYDGSEQEPLVLPAAFPNLLVNGSSGIAVGMATNIPPHNLGEVVDAIKLLVGRPRRRPGRADEGHARARLPDRGLHLRHRRHPQAYATGRGRIVMRGTAGDRGPARAQGPPGDRHHRAAVPGQQGAADRGDRRARARQADRGDLATSATSPTATASASSSS